METFWFKKNNNSDDIINVYVGHFEVKIFGIFHKQSHLKPGLESETAEKLDAFLKNFFTVVTEETSV